MAAHFGNQYARKYTLKDALPLFQKALDYAKTEDCLCVQDAVMHSGIVSKTFYNLCEEHEVLQDIKKEINDIILVRINGGTLKGTYNPTAGIWRMKQLGERDVQNIAHSGEVKQTGFSINVITSDHKIATSEDEIEP